MSTVASGGSIVDDAVESSKLYTGVTEQLTPNTSADQQQQLNVSSGYLSQASLVMEEGQSIRESNPPTIDVITPLHVVTDATLQEPPLLSPHPQDSLDTAAYSDTVFADKDLFSSGSNDTTGPKMTSSPKQPADKYYEATQGDDIFFISHQDIIASECHVKTPNLTPDEVEQLVELHRKSSRQAASSPEPVSTSESKTDTDSDWVPLKRQRATSTRPGRKPSKARLAAQALIQKWKKDPTLGKQSVVYLISHKTTTEKRPKESEGDSGTDSDTTIIYKAPIAIPEDQVLKKKKYVKATFTMRTVGLKNHKDSKQEQKAKGRKYTCLLCGVKTDGTRGLNNHFKNTHDALACPSCSKEFYSPLSLAKHCYVHRNLDYPCGHCKRCFYFKSQRDSHEKIHTDKTRYACKRQKCTASYSRQSDLKAHIAMHDMDPLKCDYCNYSSVDKRNVKQHERTHTDEKPYQCRICEHRFKFMMERSRHRCIKGKTG